MTAGTISDRRGRLLLIGSVAVAVFMARLDIYIVSISLPTIARHFHAGTSADKTTGVTEVSTGFAKAAMLPW